MNLVTSIQNVVDQIRINPTDSTLRLFYIQYLCMDAQWDNALKQVEKYQKLFGQDANHLLLFVIENIQSELKRTEVLKAKMRPFSIVTKESDLMILQLHMSIISHEREKNFNAVVNTFEMLATKIQTPSNTAVVYGNKKMKISTDVTWIIDGDIRASFVLEYFYNGEYYWIPFNNIQSIIFKPIKTLLDTIWRSATLSIKNFANIQVTIPSRYAVMDSCDWNDDLLSNRATHWKHLVNENYSIGFGQKILFSESSDFNLLNINQINF